MQKIHILEKMFNSSKKKYRYYFSLFVTLYIIEFLILILNIKFFLLLEDKKKDI